MKCTEIICANIMLLRETYKIMREEMGDWFALKSMTMIGRAAVMEEKEFDKFLKEKDVIGMLQKLGLFGE